MVGSLLHYLLQLWRAIIAALTLRPELLQIVEADQQSRRVIAGIVFIAGVSMLFGQSVALFVNKVRPGRFIASLILNGIIFIISWVVWIAAIWLAARPIAAVDVPLGTATRIIALSAAPLVFGWLILIPYIGTGIGRLLSVWSFLIALGAVRYTFQLDFLPALICVGAGWLLMWLVSVTIGRPIVALRNLVWNRVAGTPLDARSSDILAAFAADNADEPTATGGKP